VSDRPAPSLAPIDIEADLELSVDGAAATVVSSGDSAVVTFESVRDALRAARARPDGSAAGLDEVLGAADLTVDVRVRDTTVAVAGPDARPGALSGLLGVAPAEVRPGGALRAAAGDLLGG
jgi:hypothetical protein